MVDWEYIERLTPLRLMISESPSAFLRLNDEELDVLLASDGVTIWTLIDTGQA